MSLHESVQVTASLLVTVCHGSQQIQNHAWLNCCRHYYANNWKI